MNVALYYPWLYLTSGAERSILELTGASRHLWTIYTNRYEPEHTFPGFRDRDVRVLEEVPVERTVAAAASGAWRILTQRLPLEGHDALMVVCEGFGDLVLFRNGAVPSVCLCLTPLRVAFDSAYRERCFRNRGVFDSLVVRAGTALFRHVDRMAWRRYSRILCISDEVRRRAVAGGLARPERIDIAYPGVGVAASRPSTRSDRFFLLPGRIMWTKNIELGIEAFARFRSRFPEFSDFRLVIAGMVDEKSKPYLESLKRRAEQAGGVEFRMRPSDADLARLYSTCCATLFTAFNEDWGIVPLESMSFGKPVVCSNRGGPRESVRNGVDGLLVEPEPEAFVEAMAQLAGNPEMCRRLGSAGYRNVKRFSWQSFTDRIDESIDAVAVNASGMRCRETATQT